MENKQTVLVVDDTPENIDILVGVLKLHFHVKAATNGEMALKIARTTPPDIILLDIMMPDIDGFEVCRQLKADLVTRHIPIIFITAKISVQDEITGFQLGAVDYIVKPISPPLVLARVKTQLALHDQNQELDRLVREKTQQLEETQLQIVRRLGRAAEFRDNETGMHVIRMSYYAKLLGLAAGMSTNDANLLLNAAPMHDIGKIGIPDSILRKPGKLDAQELKIMQTHCEIGARIIGDDASSELLKIAKIVALTHHEKWDGSGYPNGLSGENIPRIGRIVAIADVFDALTSDRPYKRAWTIEEAVKYLKDEAGRHLDPHLVELFIQLMPRIAQYKEEHSDP